MEISEKFSFTAKFESDISHLKTGLDSYINNYEKAKNLDSMPIFLDTNVLLYFYKVSNKVKKNFIQFLRDNITEIYITEHVKNEFLKSRVKVINNDYLNVLKDVPSDFKKQINKVTHFINSNKILLNDYADIYLELQDIENNLSLISNKLTTEIKKDLEKNKNIKYNDPLLDEYCNIKVINNLSEAEIKFVKEEFTKLNNDGCSIYPGMKDDKKTNSNSDGDFIIFHEMMKYMKEQDSNIIFLTNDIKEDWFEIDTHKNKQPHLSYIEITYNNTNRFNYILEANRTLSDLLDIKINSNTYQKKRAQEEKILKEKSFFFSWADEFFLDYINNRCPDIFSLPISQVELEYGVELSDVDFGQLLDDNQTPAVFYGNGIAYNLTKDEDDNEVAVQISFSFNGSCTIYSEDKTIDIDELSIDEEEVEVN